MNKNFVRPQVYLIGYTTVDKNALYNILMTPTRLNFLKNFKRLKTKD